MRRTRVFRSVANVGLSAALVVAGATGFVLAAPTAGSDNVGPGFVQQAQAKTSTAKAKKKARKAKAAYKKFMATDGWRWGTGPVIGKWKPSNYRFATVDINGDGVPELIDFDSKGASSSYRARIYAYRKGRVSRIGKTWRVPPTRVYKKGHLLYHRYMAGGAVEISHYKLKDGKLKRVALASGSYFDPDPYSSVKHVGYLRGFTVYYQHLKINGKSVSWKGYQQGLKKLRKNSTKHTRIKYHVNTPENRARYL